jgi:hypothetical protein
LGVIPLFQIRSPVLVTESDKKMPPPCNTTWPYTPFAYGFLFVKTIPSVGLISTPVVE